ncbi:hypothetical protein [Actinospongicola halichondriae]|uniref:hypothetical protein n=1 Tax=Actinospongicola halichondriae TaxID=3236844 RepID=UPI003D4AA31B
MSVARRGDRATGVFGTTFGFTVFLIFLLFTVQLLFGLYVRTTVTAVATDLAQQAANEGPGALSPERRAYYEDEAHRRLGDYADDATFDFLLVDVDADGQDDTVAVHVEASLPTLLPARWIPGSPTSFERTMRARLEELQIDPADAP